MSLRRPVNYLARKLLYLWVKTEISPAKIEELNLQPNLPVIYVLEARAWSHLLVLEAECQRLKLPLPLNRIPRQPLKTWHSVYTIAPKQPFKAWLNNQSKRSRMLRGIVQYLRDHPEEEVQFVPVSIFWGRPIATQKHWLQVLFADSWRIGGRIRKLFTILLHGRSTYLKLSPNITCRGKDFVKQTDDAVIDHLQQLFSQQLSNMRSATLGPDVSHRSTLLRKILLKPDVQKAIKTHSQTKNQTEYQATLQARGYLKEIVANCTQITIQVMQRILTRFWNRFYSGIDVSNTHELKQLALSHELIYVPCHRSHIDYLLLSYVIYHQGLALPYIAAGKNLNMPLIGTVLRSGGAFFIRRSFKGNPLYSTVMFEYMAELVSKGVPLEYFIEGGRSRTGRLLNPKPGMLAMTVRGFLKYRRKPVVFMPVYIGYEKLLESKAYQAELSGEKKKTETLVNSVKSILRIRGEFGKVSTNFGKPIFLDALLDEQNPAWQTGDYDDAERPTWVKNTVNQLSTQIAEGINDAVVVNPVNLIATVLLATIKQSMDEAELANLLQQYQEIISDSHYSERLLVTQKSGLEQIQHAESLKMVKRRKHEMGDLIYLEGQQAITMTYYRNNILHVLALPAVIACCFNNKRQLTRKDLDTLVSLAYPFLQNELFLTWDQQSLPAAIQQALKTLCRLGFLQENNNGASYSRSGAGSQAFAQLTLLAKVISPTLEVYYLTLTLLSRHRTEPVAKAWLENECQLVAQRVAMIYEFNSPDYSDKNLISNFIDTLIHIDYLTLSDSGNLTCNEAFKKSDKRIRLLLNKQTRTNILQMVRAKTTR